ncbi:50S ribosomal protein L32 [Candidatus Falkowbacteria bacterium]|nr:50S ribosomal protein L32 [Candidatus Falkowbacteria bacterium]
MTIPAKRKARAKTRKGRSHEALKPVQLIKCAKCRQPALPHRACVACGSYNGRTVLTLKSKLPAGKSKPEETAAAA